MERHLKPNRLYKLIRYNLSFFEKIILNKKLLMCVPLVLFAQTAYSSLEGYNDNTWADISDEFSISKKDVQQKRSFSDINDSEGLMSLGAFVKLTQDINLRKTPGGKRLKPVLKDQVYQVLGVIVKPNGARYYKIKDKDDVGFIYSGSKKDYQLWTTQVWSDDKKVIALPGDTVKVKREKGFALFKQPGGDKITTVSKNRKFLVQDTIEDNDGRVVYFVKYRNKEGYITAGNAENLSITKNWKELH